MPKQLKDRTDLLLQATDGKPIFDTGFPVGSINNFAYRLRSLLPVGWFPLSYQNDSEESAPVLMAVLKGFASIFSLIWGLIVECQNQMRLKTMEGSFVDLLAADYFGIEVMERMLDEDDEAYKIRIVSSLIADCNTRSAIYNAIKTATKRDLVIVDPNKAKDCHAWASLQSPCRGGGYGYGCQRLRYGHLNGGQFFIEAALGEAKDKKIIYDIIDRTSAAGILGWVRLED